jgi:hypothetical protein
MVLLANAVYDFIEQALQFNVFFFSSGLLFPGIDNLALDKHRNVRK